LKEVSAQAADEAERQVVLQGLEGDNWNCKQVAQELEVCYKTLLNKLHKWQIPLRYQPVRQPAQPPLVGSANGSRSF